MVKYPQPHNVFSKGKCDTKGRFLSVEFLVWFVLIDLLKMDPLISAGENSYKYIHQQQQQRWLSVGQLASITSQSRFRSPAPVSSAVSFTVEVMRNVKEGGNTFFNSRLFGKHLSQMSLLLGDPREEVERTLPSVQGR